MFYVIYSSAMDIMNEGRKRFSYACILACVSSITNRLAIVLQNGTLFWGMSTCIGFNEITHVGSIISALSSFKGLLNYPVDMNRRLRIIYSVARTAKMPDLVD